MVDFGRDPRRPQVEHLRYELALAAANPLAGLFGSLGGGGGAGMDFAAMQRQMQEQMMANPGMMEQMMNSPAMEGLMSNPEMLTQMIQSNPQLRQLMEQNPELRAVLSDPALMRQSLQAATNPALRAELTRNTDRAMANIEGMPGGYNALAHMYQNVQTVRVRPPRPAASSVCGLTRRVV